MASVAIFDTDGIQIESIEAVADNWIGAWKSQPSGWTSWSKGTLIASGANGTIALDDEGITFTGAFVKSGFIQTYWAGGSDSTNKCRYCGTRFVEDKYHPGTCGNCGALE